MTSAPSGGFGIVWESWVQEGFFPGVFGQRYDSSGAPLGAEFRVNTHTMGNQIRPAAASDAAGNFVVVWNGFDADSYGVFGQRFAADGSPVGSEFRVNTHTTDSQSDPHVGVDASGNFAVVWESRTQDGSEYGVFGQRFDISGPLGPEFRVSTYTQNDQWTSAVAADAAGNFVVVWASPQEGLHWDIYGQRYSQIVPVELMRFGVE